MDIIADLHIHGRYSRATSKFLNLNSLSEAAKVKGINLLGTADFTHPLWLKELREKLEGGEDGVYQYHQTNFILSVEISNIFTKNIDGKEKQYKIHTVLLAPSFDVVEQINEALSKHSDLNADGRPTINASLEETLELLRAISPNIGVIAAHIWTPWFSLFGSKFGADSVEEVYGKYADWLLAMETGLSSDPRMNWAVEKNARWPLISNSDAHSLESLGREATKLSIENLTYSELIESIRGGKGIIKTYEYFPEEGKYFWDGHRKCGVCMSPEKAVAYGNYCPVCKKPLTLGVLHRVMELGGSLDVKWPKEKEKPFQHIIPLRQLISRVLGKGVRTKAVDELYDKLVRYFGSELAAYEASDDAVSLLGDDEIKRALMAVKRGNIYWKPGCDGVFGDFSFEEQSLKNPKQKTLLGF